MVKLLVWWFGELAPDKQIIENNIKNIIKNNYENVWYVNIETPAVESNEVLTSKWWDEVSKQIFWLYWLKQWASDLKWYSLHFDLTVPFARYVVDNEENIKFPFKRYQIQKVWRWERQQKWRFKEFTQCDIDVIWAKLSLNYDSEIISTLYNSITDIFLFLKIDKKVAVHLNNKKFIYWICEKFGFDETQKQTFFRLLDNFYKLEKDLFLSNLKEISNDNFEELNILLNTKIEELNENDDFLKEWITELKQVYNSLKTKNINVIFDPYITRWLDYYTWTVFETFVVDNFDFWSICSGWRYDNLVDSIKKISNNWKSWNINYMWVWWSIGLSRLFSRLMDSSLINLQIPLCDVIFLNLEWTDFNLIEKLALELRKNNIKTDIYFNEEKLQKQFIYAESKNIPFAIIAWWQEILNWELIVKDLIKREQETIKIENLTNYLKNKINI